jgi:hypothetical protein
MSAKQDSSTPAGKTKKFGKSERHIPHHSQKAKKYYPAEDEVIHKKVSTTDYDCSYGFSWEGINIFFGVVAPHDQSTTAQSWLPTATHVDG